VRSRGAMGELGRGRGSVESELKRVGRLYIDAGATVT
jgi:hypothetical protein